MLVDIHTHNTNSPDDVIAIRNLRFGIDNASLYTGQRYSLGVHPWDAASDIDWKAFEALAAGAVAIGECGLDRSSDNMPAMALQHDVFLRQLLIAATLCKPVIIHCVKCLGALTDLLDDFKAHYPQHSLRMLIHGCYASKEWINQMIRRSDEVFFSVGPAQTGFKRFDEVLNAIPPDRLFLETDDSQIALKDLYKLLAANENRLYSNYLYFFRQ